MINGEHNNTAKKSATVKIVIRSVVSVAILMIALRLFKNILDYSTSGCLPAMLFLCWTVHEALLVRALLKGPMPERIRHLINADIYFACFIMLIIGGPTEKLLNIAGLLFWLMLVLSRVFSAVIKHTLRSIILNIIATILLFSLFFAIRFDFGIVSIFSIILPMIQIISVAFSQIKISILKRIIRKTFAIEILFGMLLLIVSISIVLPDFEPGIDSFSDAMWYCFAIVTTIGFGDFTSVTGLGRLLSVILGIYGIIVVSLITSIIVNFYSEVKEDKDENEAAVATFKTEENVRDET